VGRPGGRGGDGGAIRRDPVFAAVGLLLLYIIAEPVLFAGRRKRLPHDVTAE